MPYASSADAMGWVQRARNFRTGGKRTPDAKFPTTNMTSERPGAGPLRCWGYRMGHGVILVDSKSQKMLLLPELAASRLDVNEETAPGILLKRVRRHALRQLTEGRICLFLISFLSQQ